MLLKLIYDYLSNRKQRTKVTSSYSNWLSVFGVPQGSVLGALLFSIFLADLFLILDATDIASYADKNTPHLSNNDIDEFVKSLKEATSTLFRWFSDNLKKRQMLVRTSANVIIKRQL